MPPKGRRITRTTRILRLEVVLDDVEPAVTRTVELPDTDLAELHLVLQAAMGWENAHLHEFEVGGVGYGEPEGDEMADEAGVRPSALLDVGGSLTYTYDYGDLWVHTVTVAAITTAEAGAVYPRLLDATGACPPEDCGGPWGYLDLLTALRDPDDAAHEDAVDRLGTGFDPTDPHRDDLEAALAELAWAPGR